MALRIGLWSVLVLAGVLLGGACNRGAVRSADGVSESDMVKLYGPQKIEILPFTKFRSFDKDSIPDGMEVALRPVDEMGDPIKVFGTFIFELSQYRNASGNRAGERLESWTQQILSTDDQKRFWDRMTSTYTFQLAWEGGEFPTLGKKYWLAVSFQGPGGKRLFAETAIDFDVSRGQIREELSGGQRR